LHRSFDNLSLLPITGDQTYHITTPWNLDYGGIDAQQIMDADFQIDTFPITVTAERQFRLATYVYRTHAKQNSAGKPIQRSNYSITVQPPANSVSPILLTAIPPDDPTAEEEHIAWL